MKKLLVLLPLLLAACPNNNLPPPHPVVDTDMCEAAEQNLLKLECKDRRGRLLGGPNLHDEPFRQTCKNTQDSAVWLNPRCLSTIKDCKEVDGCLQKPTN